MRLDIEKDVTYPPCAECHAHSELVEKMNKFSEESDDRHKELTHSVTQLSDDVRWVVLIGKWMLGALVGYMILVGVKLYTTDFVGHKELEEVERAAKTNEKNIDTILGKLEIIVNRVYDRASGR